MCLTINNRKHKRPDRKFDTPYAPIIAERDILVWKELLVWKEVYGSARKDLLGLSPYLHAPYREKHLYTAEFTFDNGVMSDYYSAHRCLNEVHAGLHAHVKKLDSAYPAVIPKGAAYYIGLDNDVVSNQLMVFKNMESLKKYYRSPKRRRNC